MKATQPDRLRTARKLAGLSVDEAAYRLRDVVPECHQVRASTLTRLETGRIATIDTVLLMGLAAIYDVSMEQLAPGSGHDVEQIADLAVKIRRSSTKIPAAA